MRATRVIYVEDDPALRGVVASLLGARPELELFKVGASSLDFAEPAPAADVALLDLALGQDSLTGIELGLLLRQQQSNLGVVIFTQHVVPDFVASLPEDQQMGWSFQEKRADLDVNALVEVIRSTARGFNIVDPAIAQRRREMGPSPLERLSVRQREIIALLASGQEAITIAKTFGMTASAVRKELSRVYAILVPDATEGTDIRTVAVLRYLRETRYFESSGTSSTR